MANFLEAVKGRDPSALRADIAEGVAAAASCHYANASYRVGRRLEIDFKTGMTKGDAEADALLKREGRAPYSIPIGA